MSSRPARSTPPDARAPNAASPAAPPAATARQGVLLGLLGLALAETALSIYQWVELLTLRAGGQTACAVNEAVNCETVWNSAFASRLHALFGLPVAGLGVVWGLTALTVAALLLWAARAGRPLGAPAGAVRLVGAVGALSCITFAVASARSGALCPTCLGTYVLVLGFALLALLKLPGAVLPAPAERLKALGTAAGPALLFFLLTLALGPKTPHAEEVSALARVPSAAPAPAKTTAAPSRPLTEREQAVAGFLDGLSGPEKQGLADALAAWRASPLIASPGYPVRRVWGNREAPVRVVEWTDMLCPHCAALAGRMKELKRVLPEGLMSVEARQFPLTSECNPLIPPQRTDPTGVRCLGAKAQVCLEGSPDFWELRERLFEAQPSLTAEKVKEIASSGSLSRQALEACLASPETQAKLEQDIRYAEAARLTGTPLVVVNGRSAPPSEVLLYVLALVGGDASSPVFERLPAPRF